MEILRRGRAIVFIDGNNFYFKLKELTRGQKVRLLGLNYQDFAQRLCLGFQVEQIRYYIGAINRNSNPKNEKAEKMYANQQKFSAKLQAQGVKIVWGILIQHPDSSFHEKGVDVRIAVEMIRLARENKYDEAFLLSSDTDLVPAVEEVRQLGKRVTYVGIAHGKSHGLSRAANQTKLITPQDVQPYLDKR